MFLITTADQRFWKTDEPVLFLGEWCKLYSQKAFWQNMDHEVLPYHWDDRKKFFADYQYLQELYERVLADMTRSLNAIHGEDHPVKYWRIIIGPWLFYFIQVFYDRFSCIQRAAQSGKVTDTNTGSYARDSWVPKDYSDFSGWVSEDSYNHFLYSWIIEWMKPFPYHRRSQDVALPAGEAKIKRKTWFKRIAKKLVLIYERHLPHRFNAHVLVSSSLSFADQCRLQLSMSQWPSFFAPEVESPVVEADWAKRQPLCLSGGHDLFEDSLFQIIPQQIPQAYVEGYVMLKGRSSAAYPSQPEVILTANDIYANEGFKFWTAQKVQQGTRFASVQHGGFYGQGFLYAFQEHQIRSSDIFYTWGWDSPEHAHIKPLAAAKLNQFKKGVSPDPTGKVLLTLCSMPRYSYHLYSAFLASTGTLSYLNDQFSFIRGLNEAARKDLLIRLYQQDYGWSQKERFQELFPEVAFDMCQKSMIEVMKTSRLFVATYNSTTYLESFSADFPTIMFRNPDHWEILPAAQKYFDGLRQAGILHDTPGSAARKVNEIFADPMAWWCQDRVQAAKDEFCGRFARTSDNWLQEWRNALLETAPKN
jgi:putative transferase (TIGR04331 family)